MTYILGRPPPPVYIYNYTPIPLQYTANFPPPPPVQRSGTMDSSVIFSRDLGQPHKIDHVTIIRLNCLRRPYANLCRQPGVGAPNDIYHGRRGWRAVYSIQSACGPSLTEKSIDFYSNMFNLVQRVMYHTQGLQIIDQPVNSAFIFWLQVALLCSPIHRSAADMGNEAWPVGNPITRCSLFPRGQRTEYLIHRQRVCAFDGVG